MKEPKSLASEFHENRMDPQGTLEILSLLVVANKIHKHDL